MNRSFLMGAVICSLVLVALCLPSQADAQTGVLYVVNDKVGIGTDAPSEILEIAGPAGVDSKVRIDGPGGKQVEHVFFDGAARSGRLIAALGNTAGNRYFGFISYQDQDGGKLPMRFFTPDANGAVQTALYMGAGQPAGTGGYIGMGMSSPAYPLHMASGAHVTAGGVWTNASSRDYKENIADLPTASALAAVMALQPVTFDYKHTGGEHHVGFIAEDVPDLVATPDRKSLSTMDIVAALTKVVQEQQRTIDELKNHVAALQGAK